MTAARRAALASFAIVAVAVCVLRAPALGVDVITEDEALYAATAASMSAGAPPYRAGVDAKPPGIFYAYQAGFAVVGRYDLGGLHALTFAWVLGTALLVGALARRGVPRPGEPPPAPLDDPADARGVARPKKARATSWRGKRSRAADAARITTPTAPPSTTRFTPAVTAALFYAGFGIVQAPTVLATHAELLFSLPLALAAYLVVRGTAARTARSLPALAAAGVCAGIATLILPTAVAFLIAALGWLVMRRAFLRGPDPWLADLARAAALVLGVATVWLLAAAYFAQLGVWDDLVAWAIRWPLGTYIPVGSAHAPWTARFVSGFVLWFVLLLVVWVLAVRALRAAARAQLARRVPDEPDAPSQVVWLLAAWTSAATALTFLGGRFLDHYFTAVLPPLSALAAIGYLAVRDLPAWRRAVRVFTVVPIAACWLGAWQFSTTMSWLGEDPAPADAIAAYAHAHTSPTERIFVWGDTPSIYVAADRLAATRFVDCRFLTGAAALGLPLGPQLPAPLEDRLALPDGFTILLGELDAARPALIIDTSPGDLHHWRRYPLSRYPALAAYIAANYHAETTLQGAVLYRRTLDLPHLDHP